MRARAGLHRQWHGYYRRNILTATVDTFPSSEVHTVAGQHFSAWLLPRLADECSADRTQVAGGSRSPKSCELLQTASYKDVRVDTCVFKHTCRTHVRILQLRG